jgi:hypothetical protein
VTGSTEDAGGDEKAASKTKPRKEETIQVQGWMGPTANRDSKYIPPSYNLILIILTFSGSSDRRSIFELGKEEKHQAIRNP